MSPLDQCERCQRFIEPRGGVAPRFCPLCGQRLGAAPAAGDYAPPPASGAAPGQAIASLVLGIFSLIVPMIGLVLGLMALGFGLSAKKTIRESRYPRGGGGMATAGITLGTISTILWALLCLGVG